MKGRLCLSRNTLSWPDKKKIEVATAHSMGLTAPMIEAATGVPRQTIRHWRLEDWFKDLISEIQREDDNNVDAKLTKIVSKSLDNVVDRLENGDYMYDPKQGKFIRKPMTGRDTARVADIMFDKRNLLRGKPTSISGKQEQISDRLLKLAQEFERFTRAKTIEGVIIDRKIGEGLQSEVGVGEESIIPRIESSPSQEASQTG